MNIPAKYYELCVLIPCYNNLAGLKKSIESVFYEAGKYLFVIVDDGSDEKINKELLVKEEDRHLVQVLRLEENRGITIALNTGLQWILDSVQCDYIARLDCGDICNPERFYKQIEFLSVNTDIVLLGSWCYFQDHQKNIIYKYKAPLVHNSILKALYFKNVFIHPTIIIRTSIIKQAGLYPKDYPHAEDYAWFWTIANLGRTAILPLYLVVCDFNIKGISYSNRSQQLQSRMAIVKKFGHKFAFRQLSIIKTLFLMKIPNSTVLKIKRLFS